MKLYLVQHGEACSKAVDPERPLTERGEADIDRLAAFLAKAGVKPDRFIHSGRLRAVQTAERLAKAMAPGVELEESGLIGPDDNPGAFDWQNESWDRDTLVVGHLPFMGRLVSHLLTEDYDEPIVAFEPGCIVCLERRADAHWQIDWMIAPSLLSG